MEMTLRAARELLGSLEGNGTAEDYDSSWPRSESGEGAMLMMMNNMSGSGDPRAVSSSSLNHSSASSPPLASSSNNDSMTFVWPGEFYYGMDGEELPLYLRVTALFFLLVIFAVGTVGNTMVIIVINCSRDMRTSTNIFLVNLSVADLLVLVICTPTCIMEVWYDPQIWLLGEAMCKLVPLLEVIVAHASVLTILAISFERYYAICNPLRANYVCTKARAVTICIAAWLVAGLITSPMYWMINFNMVDPSGKATCDVAAGTFWPDLYTFGTIILFFLLPLIILIVTYGLIARNLTADSCRLSQSYTRQTHKARQQVVLMLGTVVFTFFLCLLPFRVLTIFVLLVDGISNMEVYYNVLYFCRIMLYINSALNPILYNIMSSKFRNGFLTLCKRRKRHFSRFHPRDTFHTVTTTSSASTASNISTNYIHSTALACTNHDRRRTLKGIGLYGQCCRCQCHDYVTHVLDESTKGSGERLVPSGSNNNPRGMNGRKLAKHILKNKRNNNKKATSGYYAHWYCRKCRENPKWEGGASPSSLNARSLGPSISPPNSSNNSGKDMSPTIPMASNMNAVELVPGSATLGMGTTAGSPTPSSILNTDQHGFGSYSKCKYERTLRTGHSEKCFSLNCQFCKRRGRHILYEERRVRDKGMNKGKMTIKSAFKNNYYSCSFASFSNTNTLETIL